MGREKKIKNTAKGTRIIFTALMERSKALVKPLKSLFAVSFEKEGRLTLPIAIPNTAKGRCITRYA